VCTYGAYTTEETERHPFVSLWTTRELLLHTLQDALLIAASRSLWSGARRDAYRRDPLA